MQVAENTVMILVVLIVSFYVFLILYFTIEHRMIRCSVFVPEYKKEHKAGDYMEALEWCSMYPTETRCIIENQGKIVAVRG